MLKSVMQNLECSAKDSIFILSRKAAEFWVLLFTFYCLMQLKVLFSKYTLT